MQNFRVGCVLRIGHFTAQTTTNTVTIGTPVYVDWTVSVQDSKGYAFMVYRSNMYQILPKQTKASFPMHLACVTTPSTSRVWQTELVPSVTQKPTAGVVCEIALNTHLLVSALAKRLTSGSTRFFVLHMLCAGEKG